MSESANVFEINNTHKKEGVIINALQSAVRRLSASFGFGVSPDGKRDYNALFGYGTDLTYSDFYGMYKRGGLGNAVVKKVARACWGEKPKLKVGEQEILENEIALLAKKGLFSALQKADILNRIGNFSVLLIGLPDGQDLDQPLGKVGTLEKSIKNMYFNAYNYDGVTITKYDESPTSPRFNLPEIYQLQTSVTSDKAKDTSFKAINVHHSRIVHFAEGSLESSIEGESALEPIWNALLDSEKVRGGSGEAFFRNARQQRALEADKDSQLEAGSEALTKLNDNIQAFDNGWESTLRLKNMKANHLPISSISPRDSFDVSVETISGQTGIPVRVLTGKGGGQTTGEEDRASWNQLIMDRRDDFCDQKLFRALEILADCGAINLPDNVETEWPPQRSTTEKEQSEINKNKADTFDKVVTAMGKPYGDEAKANDVLAAVGLDDIKIDDSKIELDNEPEPDEELDDDKRQSDEN
jgi:uncharacterized protein